MHKKLHSSRRVSKFNNGFSRNDLKPLHEHLVLFITDLDCLINRTGPVKSSDLETFIAKEKTIALPDKRFYTITSFPTEEKDRVLIVRIEVKLKANDC